MKVEIKSKPDWDEEQGAHLKYSVTIVGSDWSARVSDDGGDSEWDDVSFAYQVAAKVKEAIGADT